MGGFNNRIIVSFHHLQPCLLRPPPWPFAVDTLHHQKSDSGLHRRRSIQSLERSFRCTHARCKGDFIPRLGTEQLYFTRQKRRRNHKTHLVSIPSLLSHSDPFIQTSLYLRSPAHSL